MNKSFLKSLAPFIAAALLSTPAPAQENAYDLVGKVLVPLANLFVATPQGPNRALSAELVLEEGTNLPPNIAGQAVNFQIQYPDKFLIHGAAFGEQVTVCRNGQELWVHPGAKIEALLPGARSSTEDTGFQIPEFSLPVTGKQLIFLPALFRVHESEGQVVNGVTCRALDVSLMPELARSLKAEGWVARLWVRPDATLARVEVARGQWHVTIGVKHMAYAPSLPPESWQPDPAIAKDVLRISPSRYKQLLDAAVAGFVKYKQPGAVSAPAGNP